MYIFFCAPILAHVVKPFLGDLRHFLSQNNVGLAVARNRGVEATKSTFLAFLDNKKSRLTDNVIFHEVVNLLVQSNDDFFRNGRATYLPYLPNSSGAGAVMTMSCLLTGWTKAICRACKLMPPSLLVRRAPYLISPLIGQPIAASWQRIW